MIMAACLLFFGVGCAAIIKDVLSDPRVKSTLNGMASTAAGEAATKAVGAGTPLGEVAAYILAILTTGGVGAGALNRWQKKDRRTFHGEPKGGSG